MGAPQASDPGVRLQMTVCSSSLSVGPPKPLARVDREPKATGRSQEARGQRHLGGDVGPRDQQRRDWGGRGRRRPLVFDVWGTTAGAERQT